MYVSSVKILMILLVSEFFVASGIGSLSRSLVFKCYDWLCSVKKTVWPRDLVKWQSR